MVGQVNSLSATTFEIPIGDVNNGTNRVEITTNTTWPLQVNWAQLIIDGGDSNNANITGFNMTSHQIVGSTVTVDVAADIAILANGDYRIEVNLIDESGNNTALLTEDLPSETIGNNLTQNYSPTFQITDDSGLYTIECLLFYDNSGFPLLQNYSKITFTHAQNLGLVLPSSLTNSTVTPQTPSIEADGVSSTVVTIQLKDQFGQNLVTGGDNVTASTSDGSLSVVADNNDGSYDVRLTSSLNVGSVTVTAYVDAASITDTATVNFSALPASAAESTLSASPTSILASGVSTSTITINGIDKFLQPLTTGGSSIVLSTTLGTIGNVTDNLDGTYSATLTSPTNTGIATISGTLDGTIMTNSTDVTFFAGIGAASNSIITAQNSAIIVDGNSTTITVQAYDINNNLTNISGQTVALSVSPSIGTLSTVTDNLDGTYSASLTSLTTSGTVTIRGSIDGTNITSSTTVDFLPGPPTTTNTTISTASPTPVSYTHQPLPPKA